MLRRMSRGIKRGFETMEHEVEPLIERVAGDVEMGITEAGELLGIEGAGEAVTFDAMTSAGGFALEIPAFDAMAAAEMFAAPEIGLPLAMMGGVTYLAHKLAGKKRKRGGSGVINRRAPARPPGIERPGKDPKMAKKLKKVKRKDPRVKKAKSKRAPARKVKTSSKKKTKKKVTYSTTTKQEVHGKLRRRNVSYFGFQATAGMHELFMVAADSFMRAFLKRYNVTIRRSDEAVPVLSAVPAFDRFNIQYRRTKYDDGTLGSVFTGPVHQLGATTYDSVVSTIADEFQTQSRDGYYPMSMLVKNSSSITIARHRNIGEAKLNLSVKRMIKLRNITKNDDNGDTLTSLDTNPLQGRLYKFRHDVPRVNPVLYESDPTDFAKFHDRTCTAGVIFGPQRAAADDHDGVPVTPNFMTEDKVLSSPPPGGRIWDNLSSSKKIGLMPGQAATHKMAFKYSGTIRQFLDKFAANVYQAPSIGYCHMFGFEQKFKTDDQDEVNIEYDCDDLIKGGCVLAREDATPPTVRTHHAHNSAYV